MARGPGAGGGATTRTRARRLRAPRGGLRNRPELVGWREWVSLPEWGVGRIRAKIDTGARTSALHVDDLEILADGLLSFDVVLDRGKDPRKVHVVVAERVRVSKVRPSSGIQQARHVVETRIRLGGIEKKIEVNLVDRGPMLCRMLVGRTALAGDFIVAPDKAYLHDDG